MAELKLTDEVVKGIVSDMKNGMLGWEIARKYDIARPTLCNATKKAIKKGDIKKEEYEKWRKENIGIKVTDEMRKEIISNIRNGEFGGDIIKKHGIKRYTFFRIVKNAKENGYLAEKEHQKWIKKNISQGRDRRVFCDMKEARRIGSKGGMSTQKKHPDIMMKNRTSGFTQYKISYPYMGEYFSSKLERFTAAMLLEFGALDKIVKGENYQIRFGRGKHKADFIAKGIIVEPHGEAVKEYYKQRKKILKNAGLNGELVIISKKTDMYELLEKMGYDMRDYWKKQRKALEKIKEEDSSYTGLPKGRIKNTKKGEFYFMQKKFPISHEIYGKFEETKDNAELRKKIHLKDISLEKTLFLDIETTGLSKNDLTIIIGAGRCENGHFIAEQYFARNQYEEKGIISYLSSKMKEYNLAITHGGASFDISRLKARSAKNNIDLEAELKRVPHADMIYLLRSCKKIKVPDYRLQTIEKIVLGYKRPHHEINPNEIKGVYYKFVRTKDASEINELFKRNAEDVYSTFREFIYYLEKDAPKRKI